VIYRGAIRGGQWSSVSVFSRGAGGLDIGAINVGAEISWLVSAHTPTPSEFERSRSLA